MVSCAMSAIKRLVHRVSGQRDGGDRGRDWEERRKAWRCVVSLRVCHNSRVGWPRPRPKAFCRHEYLLVLPSNTAVCREHPVLNSQ